jgi:hypothetical protein
LPENFDLARALRVSEDQYFSFLGQLVAKMVFNGIYLHFMILGQF